MRLSKSVGEEAVPVRTFRAPRDLLPARVALHLQWFARLPDG
jgi:hypothetical protein